MADKEYIERDSIYRRVKERTNPYGKHTLDYESGVKVLNMIKQEPAADVVEVVRCNDCAVPHNGWTGCPNLNGLIPPADFYCARGERKEQI